MNIEKCVENIPCKKKKDMKYDEVAHCTTEEEMVCCLNVDQCWDEKNKNHMKKCNALKDTENKKNMLLGKCHFPFIYDGKLHYKCTSKETPEGDNKCYRWCATLLNENNVYIENSGLWGYCSNQCEVNYDESCKKKRKHEKKKSSQKKGKQNLKEKKKQDQVFPRFKEEHEKELENPRPEEKEHQCLTRNTTTTGKNKLDGTYQEFTLTDPGPCSFPFNYKGEWYSTCIAQDDPVCRFWCSVENDHGYHRKKGSKWAYCKEVGCNMNKTESEYKTDMGPKCYLDKKGMSQIKMCAPLSPKKNIQFKAYIMRENFLKCRITMYLIRSLNKIFATHSYLGLLPLAEYYS